MTAASPLRPEGTMSEPWHGSRPPDELVTLTLPYRTAKRVLVAVVSDAQRANSRGNDPAGVKQLALASNVLGDAIDAPAHRRFRLPEKLFYAVIAGSEAQYDAWLRTVYEAFRPAVRAQEFPGEPIYVDSAERALSACYYGYVTLGTAHLRADFKEILAAVTARTFRSGR